MDAFVPRGDAKTRTLVPLARGGFSRWLHDAPRATRAWVESVGWTPEPGRTLLVPGKDHALAAALLGVEGAADLWSWGALAPLLPRGRYRLDPSVTGEAARRAALGWALGRYSFDRYRKPKRRGTLVWPSDVDRAEVTALLEGIYLGRDLVNTPANDMGPAELAAAAEQLAARHGTTCQVVVGDELLQRGFPLVHAVGRASTRAPRLVDLRWGGSRGPRLTLVGKGVCFDSGGLDLKSADGMLLMKKDMGGAATVLALAHVIMAMHLPVRLRVLIPAVENSVAGDAFRPLDVIRTRKGTTVEIGNTDAEGRLVLCDALAYAEEEEPDLLVDFATLTGAARIALGTEVPAVFSDDDALVSSLMAAAAREDDPLWRLPLHRRYRRHLDSELADLNNTGRTGQGGAITAALFLSEFVDRRRSWVHVDTMAWNSQALPGRPVGGDVPGLRAFWTVLRERYAPR
jgi:leucyl aminopeptidase